LSWAAGDEGDGGGGGGVPVARVEDRRRGRAQDVRGSKVKRAAWPIWSETARRWQRRVAEQGAEAVAEGERATAATGSRLYRRGRGTRVRQQGLPLPPRSRCWRLRERLEGQRSSLAASRQAACSFTGIYRIAKVYIVKSNYESRETSHTIKSRCACVWNICGIDVCSGSRYKGCKWR